MRSVSAPLRQSFCRPASQFWSCSHRSSLFNLWSKPGCRGIPACDVSCRIEQVLLLSVLGMTGALLSSCRLCHHALGDPEPVVLWRQLSKNRRFSLYRLHDALFHQFDPESTETACLGALDQYLPARGWRDGLHLGSCGSDGDGCPGWLIRPRGRCHFGMGVCPVDSVWRCKRQDWRFGECKGSRTCLIFGLLSAR